MKIKMICVLYYMYQSLTMINHYYGWALDMYYNSLANGGIKEYIINYIDIFYNNNYYSYIQNNHYNSFAHSYRILVRHIATIRV